MKVAISLPDPVFDAAERLAEELHVSRSHLYAQALSAYVDHRGAAAVTARLNEIHGTEASGMEPALVRAQSATLGHEAW